jgi:hypothetical protein
MAMEVSQPGWQKASLHYIRPNPGAINDSAVLIPSLRNAVQDEWEGQELHQELTPQDFPYSVEGAQCGPVRACASSARRHNML